MVKKKGKSKRITLKDKYKIQRRVVESHRKSRKQAKRDTKAGIVKHDKKKDPGIPNSWPFKQELLQNIKQEKGRLEARKAEEKERRRQGGPAAAADLTALVARAQQEQDTFAAATAPGGGDAAGDGARAVAPAHGQQSRRAYLRSLKQVIESSDVVLQVLDARDPLGTRIHPAIEAGILSHHDKRMVLVLNKIDLIPKSNVSEWLTFLRRSHPTVALKAGTTQQGRSKEGGKASGVGRTTSGNALASSLAVGVDGLLQLLKNYARASGEKKSNKTCITVGIVGYPNVGKSSILNSLKRCRAVGVSPRPGCTTSLQEVVLDRSIRLVDSPGVVFDDDVAAAGAGAVLRNGIDADSVADPVAAVQELLGRCTMESLMMTYNVPAFPRGPEGVMTFLAMVARVKGRVLKGGIPDKIMAGRSVIRDWNKGKIPYYSVPPQDAPATTAGGAGREGDVGSAKIVSSFGEEFDVNKIFAAHDKELMEGLEDVDEMDFVQMNSNLEPSRYGKTDEAGDDGTKEDGDVAMMNAQMADADDFEFDEA